jgi:hypothetical protein
MSDELVPLLRSLEVPLLSEADMGTLHQLQKQWLHWENREQQHAPLRIEQDRRAAYAAFLDNPMQETEQRLMVLADTDLTATRYAVLRRAFAELRGRISAQAAAIIAPVMDRAIEALHVEHSRRREAAQPVMSSKDRNPVVIDVRRAIESADRVHSRVLHASSGKSEMSPLELADVFIESIEPAVLTPKEHEG